MAGQTSPLWFILISVICALFMSYYIRSSDGDRQVYIVYMGDLPKGDISTSFIHTSMLQEVVGSKASESLVCSYNRSFHGFAAKLTNKEKEKIASMKGVVSVFPDEEMELHTTRSWDFIGFPQNITRSLYAESDIIIGMIDTGIWPESQSFDDTGFGPPPTKWNGTCQNFTCNNKIVGARFYRGNHPIPEGEFLSPRDKKGHGTHTASIAAGRLVSDASLFGLASGVARGGAPSARIAVYKVSWTDGASTAHTLKAFDDAIADGVDIISLSLGPNAANPPLNYFHDPHAIGAFHAMKNGILTSNSAGNAGPGAETVRNFSPWSLTVAAGNTDREFITRVQLGNNESYEGLSINTFDLNDGAAATVDRNFVPGEQLRVLSADNLLKLSHLYPLLYAGNVPNTTAGFKASTSRYCKALGSLDQTLVKGKIVLCDSMTNGSEPLRAGAIGIIMRGKGVKDHSRTFPLPASYLNYVDGLAVYSYLASTKYPNATIMKSKKTLNELAPYVVSSSSRGPNPITSDILKPDLTAPGVEILAAWSKANSVTGIEQDARIVTYNIESGTSMACPHATGAAAYVKSLNPDWSPAAIKSALMTTATPMSEYKNDDVEFAYGAGYIDPLKAAKPGLVYDVGELDYVKFLCGQDYSTEHLQHITGNNINCSIANNGTVWDLNYPSFTLSFKAKKSTTRSFSRTVTNVGSSTSTYKATVEAPTGLDILVTPSDLKFESLGQKISFVVKVSAKTNKNMLSGSLVWNDGFYKVRSPIVAHLAQ